MRCRAIFNGSPDSKSGALSLISAYPPRKSPVDAVLRRSAARGLALGRGHDVQQLIIVRHDVVLDRARHLFLQAVPLDGIQLFLGEEVEALRIAHLRDRIEGAFG